MFSQTTSYLICIDPGWRRTPRTALSASQRCGSMLPAPATALSTLLCALLLTDSAPVFSASVLSFSAGDSVTFSCSEEANRIRNVSQITMIVWRKENGSHVLRFTSEGVKNVSNFTDPRISFSSAEIPPNPKLQIRDARPEDTGNYTCEIITVEPSLGRIHKSWTLHVTEPSINKIISISCSVPGAIILVIIAGIIYWKFCTSHKTIPSQIHQTSTDNNEKEEPVYDNIQDDYFFRFNTLYDQTPAVPMAQRPNKPETIEAAVGPTEGSSSCCEPFA
ncbi:uncharacterized protein LOC143817884 [Ranitomeya variabilis]|uniref:uncharacterized protein LOC143817884 n=1 Tax=Ranitomeya variabilis TaxID=490064 RepID=UPI00405733CA